MLSCNHSISESRWDPATCSCGCPRRQFGEEEAACKVERQADWDPSTCTCQPRIARVSLDSWDSSTINSANAQVVERGVEAQQQYNPCTDLSRLHYSPRWILVHLRDLTTNLTGSTIAVSTSPDGFSLDPASLSSSYSLAPLGTTGGWMLSSGNT